MVRLNLDNTLDQNHLSSIGASSIKALFGMAQTPNFIVGVSGAMPNGVAPQKKLELEHPGAEQPVVQFLGVGRTCLQVESCAPTNRNTHRS